MSENRRIFKIGVAFLMMVALIMAFACEKKDSSNTLDISSKSLESSQHRGGELKKSGSSTGQTSINKEVRIRKKLPRLIDLGADKCIPCKMMAPILEELKQEYAGKLEVEIIDVWKDPEAGRQYGIQVIPTQIFYDDNGEEFYRHVGYISKEDILAIFQQKGIELNGS